MTQDNGRDTARSSRATPTADTMSPPRKSDQQNDMSVMGPDILVTGNIEATVDLLIEGRVVGDVRCMTLVLGPGSQVKGSIHAERVRVSGTVEGAIETKDLAIEASAKVKGDVTYSRIRIANGGVIEGQLKHVAAPAEDDSAETRLKLVEPVVADPAKGAAKPAIDPAKPALYYE